MQKQTTTVTTQQTEVLGTNFQITTFEMATTAFCDCCDNQATGTKDELEWRGWIFGNGSEFCPDCF